MSESNGNSESTVDATNSKAGASPRVKWTNAEVRKEAAKYKTKKEFNQACQSAYQAARKMGILDEVCSHMDKVKRGRKPGQVAKAKTNGGATASPTSTEAEA